MAISKHVNLLEVNYTNDHETQTNSIPINGFE